MHAGTPLSPSLTSHMKWGADVTSRTEIAGNSRNSQKIGTHNFPKRECFTFSQLIDPLPSESCCVFWTLCHAQVFLFVGPWAQHAGAVLVVLDVGFWGIWILRWWWIFPPLNVPSSPVFGHPTERSEITFVSGASSKRTPLNRCVCVSIVTFDPKLTPWDSSPWKFIVGMHL